MMMMMQKEPSYGTCFPIKIKLYTDNQINISQKLTTNSSGTTFFFFLLKAKETRPSLGVFPPKLKFCSDDCEESNAQQMPTRHTSKSKNFAQAKRPLQSTFSNSVHMCSEDIAITNVPLKQRTHAYNINKEKKN